MTTSYPRAEALAQSMQLPVTVCSVTKELYGYAKPILDVELAKGILFRNGVLSALAVEQALYILRERVNCL